MATGAVYLKMKTANGSKVYRNVAPFTSANKLELSTALSVDSIRSDLLREAAGAFVVIQTEDPDLAVNGSNSYFQMKIVREDYATVAVLDSTTTIKGVDNWEDITDEKLAINLTDGDKDYKTQIAKAASSVGTGVSIPLDTAASEYASAVVSIYGGGESGNEDINWLTAVLTGTKSSIIAQTS